MVGTPEGSAEANIVHMTSQHCHETYLNDSYVLILRLIYFRNIEMS